MIEGYPSATPLRVRDIMRECKINAKGVGSSRHEWPGNNAGVSGMSNGMSKTSPIRKKKKGNRNFAIPLMFFGSGARI